MYLWLMHPEVASRDCEFCLAHPHNEETGQVLRQRDGTPVKRAKRNLPPCRVATLGCAKGTPERQLSLSPKNQQCLQHWLACRSTGDWPRDEDGGIDGIVKQNAGIIEAAIRRAEIDRQWLTAKHQTRLEDYLKLAIKARAV